MITVTNIRNMQPTRYHYAFAIVRSLKKKIPYVTQLQALSPAPQIFYEYLRLQKEGKWNQAAFDNWYTKAFLHQLSQDTVAQETLRHILRLDTEGKNIVLACFCSDANLCHRTIIASILAENGADVHADGIRKKYGMIL